MIEKFLKFMSPFLSSHLAKDPASIHNALKGMSYSQAAIAFTVFMKDIVNQSYFMAVFTFIFPIFIAMGAAFGIMAQQENKRGELLSVAIFLFFLATAFHAFVLFVFFSRINFVSAIAFLFSIIAIFNIFVFGAKLYENILKNSRTEE